MMTRCGNVQQRRVWRSKQCCLSLEAGLGRITACKWRQTAEVMMVDAPLGLQPVWNVIYPLLPAATKKVRFLSATKAVDAVEETARCHAKASPDAINN